MLRAAFRIVSGLSTASEKEIQTLDTKGRELIDHLFVPALELMLLTLGLFSLVAWPLLQRFSTLPTNRAERLFHRAT